MALSATVLSGMLVMPNAMSGPLASPACSAALGQSPLSPNPASAKHGLSGPIRLLSWNIQKSQSPGWDEDLRTIGDDRHLLLIQEASEQAMLADALPQALHQVFAAGYTTNTRTTGVATLSSVAPSGRCNLTAWEPWLGTPKATNITEYPLANHADRLLVINLHAVNFTLGTQDFAAQVEALTPLLERHQGPLLVAGDFNTWSRARQSHLQDFMAGHQLAAVNFTPDHRSTFQDLPLDHMYLRGLRATEARTVEVDTSDHNPLLVTLEVDR